MSLHDPSFIRLDGTPVTGRIPARLVINGGGALTGRQQAELEQVYGQFREAVKLSVSDFHTEQIRLSDGTRVHMLSLQDRDVITVDPEDGGDEVRLPHGFAVVTNWNSPVIYKRDLNGPVIPLWEFAGDYVPQVTTGSGIFDNQAFRAEGDGYFNLPMVYHRNEPILWDYGLRAGLASASISGITPFVLKDSITGKFNFEAPRYAVEGKILDDTAAVLYTMADAPGILAPAADGYPELVRYWPAQTDASGNELALQHWRYAVISPTFNIWQFRLCNERLRRIGDSTYEALERNTQDIITPWSRQTVSVVNINDSSAGEEIDDRLTAFGDYSAGNVRGYYDPPGLTFDWSYGWVNPQLSLTGITRRGVFETAMRQVVTQEAGAYTREKVLAVGVDNVVNQIDILSELNYPATILWRGATKATGYLRSDVLGAASGYGVSSITIFRKDTKYHVDGEPRVTAKLGWKDLLLLEGTTTGRMDGKIYSDNEGIHGMFFFESKSYLIREPYSPIPGNPNYVPYVDVYAYLLAHNVRDTEYQDLMDEYWTTTWGGPNPSTRTINVTNERPTNTVEYALTSRYVIDYDHKGRFYAAIRCEVACSGAQWDEDAGVYEGFMVKTADPTYAVRIYFESCWNGLTDSQLLVEETVTRPGFEIIAVEKFSPWYWPYPAYIDRSCIARVPPEPCPDENFMMMFNNLASHQGANTNLCCADVRPDIAGGEIAKTQSQDGIEYSYLRDGQVIPHEKYVTGQLYARTFKLSDIQESLWLLRALKVDAIEGDTQPIDGPIRPSWFYHPVIKAALDVVRHIEVRDGVIGNWSDNLEGVVSGYPPTAAPPPAVLARDIKLYRV